MRKRHSLVNGRKKAVALLLSLPILAILLLLLLLLSPNHGRSSPANPSAIPKLAYLISAAHGDALRATRLLKAVYHPRNYYLLRIDGSASPDERRDLTQYAASERVFAKFGNVRVVPSADSATLKGPTAMSATLHAAAILLREGRDWSWFVNLDAADYPLVSQDDLLHVLSFLPRDLNFVEHTSNIGWKEHQRARPIIVDPGLYGSDKTDLFWVKDRRSLPSAFKLFVGSSSVFLSSSFLEFCIVGWDNLPRILLMYYTNFLASSESYFHTVICNSIDFQNTTVNHDLRFTMWDDPPRQNPMHLTSEHFDLMASSGAPFARTFIENSPVLDQIDLELLRRSRDRFTPGGWCLGSSEAGKDPCAVFGRADIIRPTLGSKRLERFLLKILDAANFRPKQCK